MGAVFPSPTKQNAIRITGDQLKEICSSVSVPAVAIGGITRQNIEKLAGGNIAGAAVVSGIFCRPGHTERNRSSKEKNTGGFKPMSVHTALTIAGSDSSGGAGIQADIKTMITNGVYAMSAITALTAQNTTGVRAVMEVSPEFLSDQLDAVFEDIYPDAVKIGMVSSKKLIGVIGEKLRFYHAKNVVADPVMVASSGSSLMENNGADAFINELFPLASLITPNIPEAEVLSGCVIKNKQDMETAAEKLSALGAKAVLLKGGHSICDEIIFLYGRTEDLD